MTRRIAVIGAPTSAGAYALGPESAPAALREAGLLDALEASGVDAVDLGDVSGFDWHPDRGSPRAMHAGAVARIAREVGERVHEARALGRTPLVLGGDCTVGIGTVAGAGEAGSPVGVLYFDPHPDLNTPGSVPDGALGWMGVTHLLDAPGAVAEVAALGHSRPLVSAEQLLLFDTSLGRTTAHERATIEALGLDVVDEEAVAADPGGSATEAAARLRGRTGRFVVHLDVDAIDFADAPLSENTDRNVGLSYAAALEALGALLADPGVAGLTVAQLNPAHAAAVPDLLVRFVQDLAGALSGTGPRPSRGPRARAAT